MLSNTSTIEQDTSTILSLNSSENMIEIWHINMRHRSWVMRLENRLKYSIALAISFSSLIANLKETFLAQKRELNTFTTRRLR